MAGGAHSSYVSVKAGRSSQARCCKEETCFAIDRLVPPEFGSPARRRMTLPAKRVGMWGLAARELPDGQCYPSGGVLVCSGLGVRIRVGSGRQMALGDQWRKGRQAVGEQLAESLVYELRGTEDERHAIAIMQGVEGCDVEAPRTVLKRLDAAGSVNDQAEGLDDGTAQALRPRHVVLAVEPIPERIHLGRSAAQGEQGVTSEAQREGCRRPAEAPPPQPDLRVAGRWRLPLRDRPILVELRIGERVPRDGWGPGSTGSQGASAPVRRSVAGS